MTIVRAVNGEPEKVITAPRFCTSCRTTASFEFLGVLEGNSRVDLLWNCTNPQCKSTRAFGLSEVVISRKQRRKISRRERRAKNALLRKKGRAV